MIVDALLDLVLPRRCVGCGGGVALLCGRCVPSAAPVRVQFDELGVVAAAAYADVLRRALILYKERGRRDLAGPLGELLGRAARTALNGRAPPGRRVVLVAVPSSRSVAAARGGDHLGRLAPRAAAVAGTRVTPGVLSLTRAVRDSAGLGVAARASNLHEAFRARPAPAGVAALLIDDIVTTGATLREAHRALSCSGWPVLGAAVVAATPRPGSNPIGSAHFGGLA